LQFLSSYSAARPTPLCRNFSNNKGENFVAEKVVVVTGASAGVGRAAVREFAKQGANIGLIARGKDGLRGAKKDVEALGGKALMLSLDVADADAVEDAASEVERKFGPIDVWVNDAMVSVFSPVSEMTAEEYRRVTEVTYLGFVHGTLAALRRMRERDRGIIVQVGSALAYRSIPLQSAYCAAKHAMVGFTDSLRCELIHERSNIKVTVVHMPALNTPQFGWVKSRLPRHPQPVPPIFEPEVAARAIVYAAKRHPRELWVGGPTVEAMIGQKIVPGLLDRYLGMSGYDAQQTSEPVPPNRPNNLWEPLPGDHGAHGAFDNRAHKHSWELEARINLPWILAAGAGVLASAFLAKRKTEERRKNQERLAA
jgi:NAD(P)-dependent dehydrogenase (short-subunit alcohol dehydrogenase family)